MSTSVNYRAFLPQIITFRFLSSHLGGLALRDQSASASGINSVAHWDLTTEIPSGDARLGFDDRLSRLFSHIIQEADDFFVYFGQGFFSLLAVLEITCGPGLPRDRGIPKMMMIIQL